MRVIFWTEYDGSTLLQPLADLAGLPCDQFNFTAILVVCLLVSPLYRYLFNPKTTSATVRHGVALAGGLGILYFAFGSQMFHLFVQTIPCYLIMKYWPASTQHVAVLAFSMIYLVWVDLRSAFEDYERYIIDVTFPLTITTEKLSGLAFSVYDGRKKKENDKESPSKAVRKVPSLLEFYSYLLNFQSVLCGPFFHYFDYAQYADGSNIMVKDKDGKLEYRDPPVMPELVKKTVKAAIFAFVALKIQPFFDIFMNDKPEFIAAHGFLYRVFFCIMSTSINRSRYYFAWKLAEAIQNGGGFGFNGYDENGKPKWDLVQNVIVRNVEFGTSMKVVFDNWNTQTTVWLRHVCYTRVKYNKVFWTFMLSATWHGIRPGYFMTFFSGTMLTSASRKLRASVRPMFQDTALKRQFYDVLTWAASHICLGYCVVPFVVLKFWPCIYFFTYSQFWWIHIGMLLVIIAVPSKKRESSPKSQHPNSSQPITQVNKES